jgi:hypothetical protein
MKEIDLLPEWYKSSKRRQVSYRTQYIGICFLALIMVVWNFTATHSVSTAEADLSEMKVEKESVEMVFSRADQIKQKLVEMKQKALVLEHVDSKIRVADILAEISFLLNEKIVLSRLDIDSETFANNAEDQNHSSGVRVVNPKQKNKNSVHYGDVKFKIVLRGVATNANVVAEFVCRLEDSPYFFNVIPSFSRTKELKTMRSHDTEKKEISEFEISCYLANYQLDESIVVNKSEVNSY